MQHNFLKLVIFSQGYRGWLNDEVNVFTGTPLMFFSFIEV